MFEKRPTDIQKIGKALMIGLFIAVPLLMFGPRLILPHMTIEAGSANPPVTILEVRDGVATVRHEDGRLEETPFKGFSRRFSLRQPESTSP